MNQGALGFPNQEPSARSFKVTGKPGATAAPPILAGGTTSGAPTTGRHVAREIVIDATGEGWYCTVGGTPGTWVTMKGAGGGGAVATDTIWDAAGDLVYGTGADTAARLAIGTALQVLRVNAGATAPEWAAPAAPSITWSTYTPTWDAAAGTGPTLGNGTIAGYYADLNDVLLLRVSLIMGSTTTYGDGTNDWRFSLPATYTIANLPASGPRQVLGSVYALDSGTAHIPGIAAGSVNTTNFNLFGPGSAGTGWKAAVPITWATNDTISINCLIHIA